MCHNDDDLIIHNFRRLFFSVVTRIIQKVLNFGHLKQSLYIYIYIYIRLSNLGFVNILNSNINFKTLTYFMKHKNVIFLLFFIDNLFLVINHPFVLFLLSFFPSFLPSFLLCFLPLTLYFLFPIILIPIPLHNHTKKQRHIHLSPVHTR